MQKYGKGTRIREKTENSADDNSYKDLGCSSTTSNTVLRAELGMYPRKTTRDLRKSKWQYEVRKMPTKRLPVIADGTVSKKTTKGRAGIR